MVTSVLFLLLLSLPSNEGTTIQKQGHFYYVRSSFVISAPLEKVHEVLTDYNHMSEFIPYLEKSVLVSTDPVTVEQTIGIKYWIFTKRLHVTLEVSEDSTDVLFRDTEHKSFNSYSGVWCLQDKGTYTQVTYLMEFDPKFRLSAHIVETALKEGTEDLVQLIKKETRRRTNE